MNEDTLLYEAAEPGVLEDERIRRAVDAGLGAYPHWTLTDGQCLTLSLLEPDELSVLDWCAVPEAISSENG